jgi:hypothetical protein
VLGNSPASHVGYLVVIGCNDCPSVLDKIRVIDEHSAGEELKRLPSEGPDGVYAIDAIYTPGVAYKIPGLTAFRSAVISCCCENNTYDLNLPNRLIKGVKPWRPGESKPEDWPGGEKAPKPYPNDPPA